MCVHWVYVMVCYVVINHHFLCRIGTVRLKALMIVDYNKHMLGLDKLSYYSFLHESVKWWCKVFFWILEVAVVNAYIMYKELALKQGDKPEPYAFRRQLIASLSEPLRSTVTPRVCSSPRTSANVECLRPVPHFPQKSTKRDCIVCSNRKEVPDI